MKTDRVPLGFFLLIVVVICIAAFDARATDRNSEASADSSSTSSVGDVSMTAGSMTGGDVSVGGDSNRAYALGMAGGTIADCMAHWGLAIVNIPARNKFCQKIDFAAWAESPARHTEPSIKIRCSTWVGTDVFGTSDKCEKAFVYEEPADYHTQQILTLSEQTQVLNEALAVRIVQLEARLTASEQKATQAKAEARKARRTAQAPPQTIIQQQPWMTDEKRAKLQAVLDE